MADRDGKLAKLALPDGTEIDLPYLEDAAGQKFVDIQKLYAGHGICTFDPGFNSTASCESKITYINGRRGQLQYRGYPIEQLAEPKGAGDFTEAAYLILYGELPTADQKAGFEKSLKTHSLVLENMVQFFKGFHHDAAPMAVMVGVVGALSSFYDDASDVGDPKQRELAALRIIAKMPTLAAITYKNSIGEPIMYPRSHLGYVENLMMMMFARPTEPFEISPVRVRALELFLILHADHEQNAGSTTARTAGSSQANPYACIASAIASLWGPAHGGANEACIRMLEGIGSVENIPKAIERAKSKDDNFRLMGFGHRVYKTYDPRAKIMQSIAHELFAELDMEEDPLLKVAIELEKVASQDEYFVQRGLYPNVDFYSGIVLRALGIPVSMFTVMFAVARSVGWMAQWNEMMGGKSIRISRPRQMYMGHLNRQRSEEDSSQRQFNCNSRTVSVHAAPNHS